MRLNPNDPELRKNWQIVRRPDAKPDDFLIRMDVGVELSDLLD